jgi:outer membrane protein OmpA-like peptidoglycan-associated protein
LIPARVVVRLRATHRRAPADQLNTAGYGWARPLFPNSTPSGRAGNRRVEFVEEQ